MGWRNKTRNACGFRGLKTKSVIEKMRGMEINEIEFPEIDFIPSLELIFPNRLTAKNVFISKNRRKKVLFPKEKFPKES